MQCHKTPNTGFQRKNIHLVIAVNSQYFTSPGSLRILVEIIQKMQVLPGEEFLSPQPWCSSVRLWAVSVKKGVEYPLLGWISQQGGGNREYHLRPMQHCNKSAAAGLKHPLKYLILGAGSQQGVISSPAPSGWLDEATMLNMLETILYHLLPL